MNRLFLSYSGVSADSAAQIDAVLSALGANVRNYREPDEDSAIDAALAERLERECEDASYFVQILEGTMGTSVLDGVPVLRQEVEWFMAARQRGGAKRPRPLILSLREPGNTPTENYVRHLESIGAEVILCDSHPRALRVVTGWFNRHRTIYTPEFTTIDGQMDIEVGEPPVDSAMSDALHKDEPIPQKLLYTSPFGALFWRNLSKNRQSSVRKHYDVIDFSDERISPVSRCIKAIASWDSRFPISIIALGCGDGRREAILASTLSRSAPSRKIKVLLVDVSKTLVCIAAREFAALSNSRNIDMDISFALSDFEHPAVFSQLMQQWSQDLPVIIVFLGNTLGNINLSSFMDTVSSAMKPDDLLLTEVSMASVAAETVSSGRGHWDQVSPQHDDRFNFLTGPVRQLGILPERRNFKVRVDEDELYTRRTYAYQFSDSEFSAIESLMGTKTRHGKLLLLRVDAFKEASLQQELSKTFQIVGGKIDIHPANEAKHSDQPRMGLFLAKRLES